MQTASRLIRHGDRTLGCLIRQSAHPFPLAMRNVHDNGNRRSRPPQRGSREKKSKESDDDLFSPENLHGISHLEVARMKVTYDLLKEHAAVVEEKKPPLDPESNPLIDPRSFEVRTLPELPKEVLTSFRRELPPKSAFSARPVPTYAVWEKQSESGLGPDLVSEDDSEWAAVDERTMDARQFSRMRRQSINVADPPPTYPTPISTSRAARSRRKCALSDERGRVDIDFRSVGKLKTFLSDGGKIFPRRKTGLAVKAQRRMSRAIKSARHMALIAPEPSPGLTLEEMQEMEENL